MFYLDNGSGVDTMPPLKATQATKTKWFTEGDDSNPESWPGQDFFNGLQAELLNVLSEAKIAPEKAKLNQLATAIKTIVTNNKPSKATTSAVGLVQLSSAINSDLEDRAATPKAVKEVAELAKKGGVPVGHIYFGLNLDATSLNLNGELYSRAAYPELWAYIEKSTPHLLVTDAQWLTEKNANGGICNKFSKGNGSTTFRLPIFSYVKGGGLGYQNAGLPNIKGELGYQRNDAPQYVNATGAFYITKDASAKSFTGNSTLNGGLIYTFDASRSTSIYGASNSVDLNAVTGFWQIKAIGSVSTSGSTDIDKMVNQINLLREELTNRVHIVDSYVNSDRSSWYRKWSDGFIEQGGIITATGGTRAVNLLIPMTSTTYISSLTTIAPASSTGGAYVLEVYNQTPHNFTVLSTLRTSLQSFNWYVKGY